MPGQQAYADANGGRVVLPKHGEDRAVAPIERDGREVAALVYDATLDDDPELIEAVRAATSVALENEHLQAESQARLAELRASRQRLVEAGDAERRRLERDLHDGAQQRLVALSLQLRLIRADIRRDPAAAEQLVTAASGELAQSLEELRELARGIHPAALDHGLESALESLAARSTVPTAVSYDAPEDAARGRSSSRPTSSPPRRWRTSASTRRPAPPRCASRARRAASRSRSPTTASAAPTRPAGSGLRGLQDRVEALDGHLLVTSPPGEGTVVIAELPCAS